MNIYPLSEGVFTIGHDKIFVPFDTTIHELHHRPTGSLLVEIQPFLIQHNHQNILLDTGLGFKQADGQLQIHANLAKLGISPLQIHKVILSHLHKDHAGGIQYSNNLGIQELSFPNATYYVSKKEFDYGYEKSLPSYVIEDFDLLGNHPHIEWLDEEGVIDGYIHYHSSGGHCPFHLCFLFNCDDEKIFFGGDVAPQMRQLKTRYVAKYDYDGKVSMEKRQAYAKQGKDEGWQFLFYHDVQMPMSTL